MKKRGISLLLVMVMLFSVLPVQAAETEGAAEPTEPVECSHEYAEAVTTEPTCTEAGERTYICGLCGDTYTEEIAALNHSWAEADCDTPATCAVCGETAGEALGHDWAEATCTEPKTCAACSVTEGEAPGHSWADGVCGICGAERFIPAAPVVKAGTAEAGGCPELTWEAVDGAVSYKVYRSDAKDGAYTCLETVEEPGFEDASAVAGEKYYYYVTAVAGDGAESEPGNIVQRTCDLAQPVVTVSNVVASGKNRLTWEAVEGAVKYRVYRAAEKDGTYKNVFTTEGTTYTNTSAEAGVKYYYKVKAIAENTDANSAYSAVKSRTCNLAQPVVTKDLTDSGKPKLTWEAVDGAVSYEIYRSDDGGTTYKRVYATENTTYTNTAAVGGTTYFYKVRAVAENRDADSAYAAVSMTAFRAYAALVDVSKLNVRAGAGTSYGVVKTLSRGTSVTVSVEKNVNGSIWCKVDGGWVAGSHLQELDIQSGGGYTASDAILKKLAGGIQVLTAEGYDVGFMLVDLTSGQTVRYNANRAFYGASTVKGPYVCSMVRAYPGALSSRKSAIKNVLYYSSNEDYTSLRNRYGNSCMVDWCEEAGISTAIGSEKWPAMTAAQLCQLWIRNEEFFNSGSTGATLGSWFERPEISPIHSVLDSKYTTRTKAGWIAGSNSYYQAANDAGIVYADNGAYAVAIMSNASARLSLLNTLVRALDAAHSEMN